MSPNGFVWYELMTSDMAAAERFYRSVVGWTAQPWGPPGGYTLMSAGGVPVTGLMPIPDEVKAATGRPMWFGYVGVADVDAAAHAVAQDGGTIRKPPTDIPEIGRFAVVADPQGATFMVFTPKAGAERPEIAPATPGHVGWHELHAAEWRGALDFYARHFGWTQDRAVDMGPMGTYQLFAAGGEAIGGMMTKFAATPHPVWQYYFTVPSLDAAMGRVTDGGGSVLNGPVEVPGGSWIANCLDPQGAAFSLVAAGR